MDLNQIITYALGIWATVYLIGIMLVGLSAIGFVGDALLACLCDRWGK